MASSKAAKGRYSSYITKKIPYIKIFNRIKIIKLFKKLLSVAYGRRKKIYYWLGFRGLVAYKKLEKSKA